MKRMLLLAGLLVNCVLHGQIFTLLKDIAPGATSGNSAHYYFCAYNGRVYFRANDNSSVNNWELWSTDGTAAGTSLVKEIDPTSGSNPNYMTVVNGKILFAANDPAASYEFFASDGTAAGTSMLKDIDPGFTSGFANASFPNNFSVMDGELYFSAKQVGTGTELWKSDGTLAGTVMIKDIYAGTGSAIATATPVYTAMNSFLYFGANDAVTGTELWKTDGTAAGTSLVKDINPGATASNPIYYFGIINNELYFAATTAANGTELWKTDGTAAGTVMVKDINPGSGSALASTTAATILNGMLYFGANNGTNGMELWKSDGTAAGTMMIKDINPGAASIGFPVPAALGGWVYFGADDGVNGNELWKTDGTAAGTVLVKDINPGAASSFASNITNIGGTILFNATTAANGTEPWRTDGTAANTLMIEDVAAGTASSSPGEFHEYNGKVYVTLSTPATGFELWVATINVIIPLRLLEFKGSVVNGYSQLSWKTDEEVNTLSFIVEKSNDGKSFEPAGVVPAANSKGIQEYDFRDEASRDEHTPTIYYRLKQVDIDGKFTYSPVIMLKFPSQQSTAIIYPNPVNNTSILRITASHKEQLSMKIFTIAGQEISRQLINVNAGLTTVSLQTTRLSAGIYKVCIESDDSINILSFVKQ